jgi:hypothetical protein
MPPRTRTPAPEAPPDAPPPDAGGYFRNSGLSELTVLAQDATQVLAPGRIAAFTRTPTHRDLAAASEADYRAQLAADETAARAAQAVQDAPTDTETEA